MSSDWERPRHPGPQPPARKTDWWRVFGIALAVVVAIVGLAFLAAVTLVVVAINSYGSNK